MSHKNESEDKLVFQDGDKIKTYHGYLTREDNYFVFIQVGDAEIRIAKSQVLKIVKRSGGCTDE